MSAQTWNAEGYAKNARFVTDLGAPVFELLAPQPGESILDLGCGDGVLTKKIAEVGCRVVGLDSSREFCVAARRLGINVVELSPRVFCTKAQANSFNGIQTYERAFCTGIHVLSVRSHLI